MDALLAVGVGDTTAEAVHGPVEAHSEAVLADVGPVGELAARQVRVIAVGRQSVVQVDEVQPAV